MPTSWAAFATEKANAATVASALHRLPFAEVHDLGQELRQAGPCGRGEGQRTADVDRGKADAGRQDAVDRALAEAGRQTPQKPVPDELLQELVAHGQRAGG